MVEFHAPPSAARGWSFMPLAGSEKRSLLPRGSVLCAADFLAIFTLPVLGSLLCQHTESLTKNLSFWSLLSLCSVLLTASHGGYRARCADRLRVQFGLTANCFLATSLGMLTLAVVLGHPQILTRHWVTLDVLATPLLLVGARTLLAPRLVDTPTHRAAPGPLVVCYASCPRDLRKALAGRNLPDQIEGVLYLSQLRETVAPHDWPILPDKASLRAKLRSGQIRDVIFIYHPALDGFTANTNHALWEEVLAYPARIWLAFEVASNLPEVLREKSGGCRLVPIVTDELLNSNNAFKRIFDITAASALLLLASPLMAICAAMIRANSPGPIFFRQLRTGAHGHQFEVLKFRTMTYDPGRSFSQACRDDPRITGVGHWLRRTSLDELPQFINVLRGDMSLVGPRPHAPQTKVEGMSFENALQLYQIRHRVKPGITGLAQIRGLRGATPTLKNVEQRLASDLEYIQSWSIWLDLSILVQTVPAVLTQINAW
jgi:exopolysaccharide biosynthesis polyprenyl glycosylphosphotransferase